MLFGDGSAAAKAAADAAKAAVRSTDNFNWTFIALLALVVVGVNNRVVFAIGSALGFSLFEIFLASTPAFIWVYKWWGALPVFITTYIPFFLGSYLIYDKPRRTQKRFCGVLWAVDALLLIVLIPLGII